MYIKKITRYLVSISYFFDLVLFLLLFRFNLLRFRVSLGIKFKIKTITPLGVYRNEYLLQITFNLIEI